MKKIILSSLACATMLLASNTSKYEFSPMIGTSNAHHQFEVENKASVGATLGIKNSKEAAFDQLEFALFHSNGVDYDNSADSTDITRLLVSGIKDYNVADKTSLYALAGVGYESLSKEKNGLDSEFVANVGFGIKYAITDSIALKAEAREVIRKSDEHSTLLHLGLAIPFGDSETKKAPEPKKEVKKTVVTKVAPAKVVDGDGDNDGVIDSMDKCPTTMDGVKVDEMGCERVDMDTKMIAHFDFDKTNIKYNDQILINKYVAYLKKFPKSKIVIAGYTDSIGSMAYNDRLGIRRAIKVRDDIVNQGIDKKRIRLEYYGETMPVIDNKTAEHRAQNRRAVSRIIR